MAKKLYVAYGSNLNVKQMKYRCPSAMLYGAGVMPDYELQFKGSSAGAFATVAPKKGSSVPVAVWEITPKDEAALDRYEGFPSHYYKENVSVQLDGFTKPVSAMVYIMNQKMSFGLPSPYYYQTVAQGYHDCGLDTTALNEAVGRSAQQYYSDFDMRQRQTSLFDYEDDDVNEDNDLDEDDDESFEMEL